MSWICNQGRVENREVRKFAHPRRLRPGKRLDALSALAPLLRFVARRPEHQRRILLKRRSNRVEVEPCIYLRARLRAVTQCAPDYRERCALGYKPRAECASQVVDRHAVHFGAGADTQPARSRLLQVPAHALTRENPIHTRCRFAIEGWMSRSFARRQRLQDRYRSVGQW